MQLLPEALTTLPNLKEALSITDTAQDARLAAVINRVTAWMERQTNRKLKARHYNGEDADGGAAFDTTRVPSEDYLYFDGDGEQVDERGRGVLYLPVPVVRPAVDENALAFGLAVLTDRAAGADGAGDTWDTTSLLEGRDYVVDYKAGKVTLLAACFTYGIRNYRVACTGGYFVAGNQPYVPGDLEATCIELCKQMYNDTRLLLSESIGTWSRSYSVTLQQQDPMIHDVLAKYTRLV